MSINRTWITHSDIKQYAEEHCKEEYQSLPHPETVSIEKLSTNQLPSSLKARLYESSILNYRLLLGQMNLAPQESVYIYLVTRIDQGVVHEIYVGERRFSWSWVDKVKWAEPFKHLTTLSGSLPFIVPVKALALCYSLARPQVTSMFGFANSNNLEFWNAFQAVCELIHRAKLLSENASSQEESQYQIVVLRLGSDALRKALAASERQHEGLTDHVKPKSLSNPLTSEELRPNKRRLTVAVGENAEESTETAKSTELGQANKRPRVTDTSFRTLASEDTNVIALMRSKTEEIFGQMAEQGRKVQEAKKIIKNMQAELDLVKTSTAQLQTERDVLATENTALKAKQESSKSATAGLECKARGLTTENQSLKNQAQVLDTEKAALEKEKNALKKEKSALESGNGKLKDQVELLEQEVKDTLTTFNNYKIRIRAIANEP